MPDPFIVMSAPNGARRQKTNHPALPVTAQELAACAEEIHDAGASILHLHVRDENNAHSLDVGRYRAAIAAIRNVVGQSLIIQVTSESVGRYSRFEQMAMVKALKPQAVSLALREICPTDETLVETAQFIGWMMAERILPQYILYDENDCKRFDLYRQKGFFQSDVPFTLMVLGRYQGAVPETAAIQGHLQERTQFMKHPWAVCGFRENEHQAIVHAARNNGHVRVGFENNIWKQDGTLLDNHAQMVANCVKAGQREGRAIAKLDDVKNLLNL